MTTAAPLLSVRHLHAHYGKSHILHGVSFDVGANEVVSLLGRNGSGRSTTMKAIMGLVPPTAGEVRLGGRELAGARPYAICRAGVAYVPEEREVFASPHCRREPAHGRAARRAGPQRRRVGRVRRWAVNGGGCGMAEQLPPGSILARPAPPVTSTPQSFDPPVCGA